MSQPTDETAEEMFERLYVCRDPKCTAAHIPMDDPQKATFIEEQP